MFWTVVRMICRYFFPRIYEGTWNEEDVNDYRDMGPEINDYINYSKIVMADKRVRRLAQTKAKKYHNRDFHHTWHEYGEGDSFDWGTPRHVVLASIKLAENPRVVKRELYPDEPFWEENIGDAIARGQYEYGWKDLAHSSSDDDDEERRYQQDGYEARYCW